MILQKLRSLRARKRCSPQRLCRSHPHQRVGWAILAFLSVMCTAGAARSQQTAFNATPNATCQRKDPFDPCIYHAPRLDAIWVDGDPSDWDAYPLLEWAPIDRWHEGRGLLDWWIGPERENVPPTGPDDLSARFKAGWGVEQGWPVLYLLVEWTDDDFQPEPYPMEDPIVFDALCVSYAESLYALDSRADRELLRPTEARRVCASQRTRGGQSVGQGLRFQGEPESHHMSLARIHRADDRTVYFECRLQLSQDRLGSKPLDVHPGASCVAFSVLPLRDYDAHDGTFSFLFWGPSGLLPHEYQWEQDVRTLHSTMGLEGPYESLFGLRPPGGPQARVTPLFHEFGRLKAGSKAAFRFNVANLGMADLEISEIRCDDPDFKVEPQASTVPPGATEPLTVRFRPNTAGGHKAVLTLVCNDPVGPGLQVWVSGQAVALSPGPAFNRTRRATCQRKDPFDAYIYHAPRLEGIAVDGDPSDWDRYPLLEWAPIKHFCEGTRQLSWPREAEGWNDAPHSGQDVSARFKAGWGVVHDWPVLYLLVEWVDDEFCFEAEAGWNASDAFDFWYGETLYDADQPVSCLDPRQDRQRQLRALGLPDWGLRAQMRSPQWLRVDGRQPHTRGAFQYVSQTKAYLECQVQLFEDYEQAIPWEVTPGLSCLAFGIAGFCDYDPHDQSFTYLTWGLSNRRGQEDDIRVKHSTIALERSYREVFGVRGRLKGLLRRLGL